MSIVVCVVGSAAALSWGAQIVLSHVVSEAKAQPQLMAVTERVTTEAYVPPHAVSAPKAAPVTRLVPPNASTGGIIFVRVDSNGMPVELSTNDGKPPAANEAILAHHGDAPVIVSDALQRLVHQHTFTGDWSHANAWHPWTDSP